jgi:type IV pilus assembly protein PilE
MRHKHIQGFSIVELLIVVAILGILAAIAIPQYSRYVLDSRRTDGKAALVEAAQMMERHFTNNHSYVGASIPAGSENGYYALTVTAADATSFTIQATAQGRQAGDQLCATMTINHLGLKTPPECW